MTTLRRHIAEDLPVRNLFRAPGPPTWPVGVSRRRRARAQPT